MSSLERSDEARGIAKIPSFGAAVDKEAGKSRTAAAFINRLFEAGIATRMLFLVDRIAPTIIASAPRGKSLAAIPLLNGTV
ncbi:MAG: hypothetical protein OXC26_24130 [Albidovulum sp.]|nr:hypothetical protein [Albidovulum sp.]